MQWEKQLSIKKIYPVQLSKERCKQYGSSIEQSNNIVSSCLLQSWIEVFDTNTLEKKMPIFSRSSSEIVHFDKQCYLLNLRYRYVIYDMQSENSLLDEACQNEIISQTIINQNKLMFIDSQGIIQSLQIPKFHENIVLQNPQHYQNCDKDNIHEKANQSSIYKLAKKVRQQLQIHFPYVNKGKLIPCGFSIPNKIFVFPQLKMGLQELRLINVEQRGYCVGSVKLNELFTEGALAKKIFAGNQISNTSLTICSNKGVFVADLRSNRLVLGKSLQNRGDSFCSHMQQQKTEPYHMFFSQSEKIKMLDFRRLSNEVQIFSNNQSVQSFPGANNIDQFRFVNQNHQRLIITLENKPSILFYTRKEQKM